jgi:CBS-domain-containing membrane protein
MDTTIPKTPSLTILNEKEVIRRAGRSAILDFLHSAKAYDIIRSSGKVVVFDVRISVQLAFYALVEHDMQAAPLWDAERREFVGLLTVTDFISILQHYSMTNTPITELSARSISEIMKDGEGVKLKHGDCFDGADADANLLQCCRLLNGKGKDFLPVILPGDAR